ncbi:hypothetical protein ACEV94_05080 [Vibrio parahaemolyticus]
MSVFAKVNMRKKIDLDPLRQAIRKHNMMAIWRESTISEYESPEEHAIKKAHESKRKFEQIMSSVKNDGTKEYLAWAINTSLNLKLTRGHSAQATGGKHWQSWGIKANKRNKKHK